MQVQEELVVSEDHMKIIKGKRTKRQRLPSPLRLAAMPSTSHSSDNSLSTTTSTIEEDQDMANCLILLAHGHPSKSLTTSIPPRHNDSTNLHRCKTCNKCFPSFQALGGHRTSHKKVKPNATVTTLSKEEENEKDSYDPTTSTILSLQIPTATTTSTIIAKSKVHECSMCGAQFSSGQALGGHMRRHRNFVSTSTTTGGGNMIGPEVQKPGNVLKLDLNLPAPEDDVRDSKFSFQPREKVIVFSTSSLVDCHY